MTHDSLSSLLFFALLCFLALKAAEKAALFSFPHLPASRLLYPRHLLIAFLIYFSISTLFFPLLVKWSGLVYSGNSLHFSKNGFLLQMAMIATIACSLLLFLLAISVKVRTSILYGNGEKKRLYPLLKGASVWIIAYPWALFTNQFFSLLIKRLFQKEVVEQTAVIELRSLLQSPLYFTIAALFVAFIVPFVEELLFRGVLLRFIAQRAGWWKAIFTSSAIFALMHYSIGHGVSNLAIVPSLFVFSCFLGIVYAHTNNLFASIGLHMAFNSFTVLFLLF